MKKGDYVQTPRFGQVRIQAVYENKAEADRAGYREPAYATTNDGYGVAGKTLAVNTMVFAAYRK